MLTRDDSRHGTHNGYRYHGCRCKACREAATREMRRTRANAGIHPSNRVASYTANRAARWVRKNHPEVWLRFRAQGLVLFGVDRPGRPKKTP